MRYLYGIFASLVLWAVSASAQTPILVSHMDAQFHWDLQPFTAENAPDSHVLTCGTTSVTVPMPTTSILIKDVVPGPGQYSCTLYAQNGAGRQVEPDVPFPLFQSGYTPGTPFQLAVLDAPNQPGGPMGWTLIGSVQNKSGPTAVSTLDASSTIDVAAGDLIVALIGHGNAPTTVSVAASTGTPTNALTFDAGDYQSQASNDNHLTFGYRLSGEARTGMTFRVTLGASRQYVTMLVYVWRHNTGGTITKDGSNTGEGTGTALASGTISTAGSDDIVFGSYSDYDGFALSSHAINSVAADGVTTVTDTQWCAWYRQLTAPTSTFNATGTLASSGPWIGNIIAFKAETAGGGGGGTGLTLLGVGAIRAAAAAQLPDPMDRRTFFKVLTGLALPWK